MRKEIVKFVAALLGVAISFPLDKEQRPLPKNKDYRLSLQVWYDGTVHWRIEQFVCNRLTLETLFPDYPTKGMDTAVINGKIVPQPCNWIPLPQEFASEEEAIEYLNSTLRSCEVMEVSHYYVN